MPRIQSRFGVADQNLVDIWWGQTVSELQDRMDRAEPGHVTFQWFHQRTSEDRDEIDANIKMRVTEVNNNVEKLAVGSSNVIKLATLEHFQGRALQTFETFRQVVRDDVHATFQRDSKTGSGGKEHMIHEDLYEGLYDSLRQIPFNMSILDEDEGLRWYQVASDMPLEVVDMMEL